MPTDAQPRLRRIEDIGLADEDVAEPLNRIAHVTRRVLAVDAAIVTLIEDAGQTIKGESGLAVQRTTPVTLSFCQLAVATGERLEVEDARQTQPLRDSPTIGGCRVVAYAAVPLRLGQLGGVLGTLCALDSQPRSWTEADRSTLAALADLAEMQIEHLVRAKRSELLDRLALRLPDPIARLGDAVRSVARLADHPDDPRLPRTADLVRSRFRAVEALTDDLVRAAGTQREWGASEPVILDLVDRVRRAVDLVRSTARQGDVVLELPDRPVLIEWVRSSLDRALASAVVSALHHAAVHEPVSVQLDVEEGTARLTVRSRGYAAPVAELLGVVAAFNEGEGAEPVGVSTGPERTWVRSYPAQATTGAGGTTLQVEIPLSAGPRQRSGQR
jgi:GAF domain-containing protein